jgi:hypothetical protein
LDQLDLLGTRGWAILAQPVTLDILVQVVHLEVPLAQPVILDTPDPIPVLLVQPDIQDTRAIQGQLDIQARRALKAIPVPRVILDTQDMGPLDIQDPKEFREISAQLAILATLVPIVVLLDPLDIPDPLAKRATQDTLDQIQDLPVLRDTPDPKEFREQLDILVIPVTGPLDTQVQRATQGQLDILVIQVPKVRQGIMFMVR